MIVDHPAFVLFPLLLLLAAPMHGEEPGEEWPDSSTTTTYEGTDKIVTMTRSRGVDPEERESIITRYRACFELRYEDGRFIPSVRYELSRTATTSSSIGSLVRISKQEFDQPGPGGTKESYESEQIFMPAAQRWSIVKAGRMEVSVNGPTGEVVLHQIMVGRTRLSAVRREDGFESVRAEFGNVWWQVTRSDPQAPEANGMDQYARVTNYADGEIASNMIFIEIDGNHHELVVRPHEGELLENRVILAPAQVREATLRALAFEERPLPWKAWNVSFLPSDILYLIDALLPRLGA
ncbi:MAG: hypothetical protein H0X45_04415 [Planctomycetes bacterium]|nr:hypothetical protein [Planctomycetota bacterium]